MALILPLVGAAVLLAPACSQEPQPQAALEAVADAPHEYAGEVITIEGKVSRVLGDCDYELEDSEKLFPDRVLTLCEPAEPGQTQATAPPDVKEGDWLKVTGAAGAITRENYEYITMLTLDDDVFGERETRPVIFAQSLQKIEAPSDDDDAARLPESPITVPTL